MASGYTLAGKTKAQQVNQIVVTATGSAAQSQQVSAQSAASLNTSIPAVVPQQNTAAQTPAPVVVVPVPVPQATPATPGKTTNNWQQQQSSGSR
jgi:predicted dinucleotide-binding enzyme